MEGMYETEGVLPGETAESILAGIRKLSGEIALQDFQRDVEQERVSQEAQSAGTEGPGWDRDVATFLGGVDDYQEHVAATTTGFVHSQVDDTNRMRVPLRTRRRRPKRREVRSKRQPSPAQQRRWTKHDQSRWSDGLRREKEGSSRDGNGGLDCELDPCHPSQQMYFDSDAWVYDITHGLVGARGICDPDYWFCSKPITGPGCVFDPCEAGEEWYLDDDLWISDLLGGRVGPLGMCDPKYWFCSRPVTTVDDDDCFDPFADSCPVPPASTNDNIVTDQDIADAGSDISLEGFPGNEDLEYLLSAALAYLRDSDELAGYACCLYFGPYHQACDCLEATINGPLIIDYRAWGDSPETNFMTSGQPEPNEFSIGRLTLEHANTVTSTGSDDWIRAVIGTAQGMMHEILHDCCGCQQRGDCRHNEDPYECDKVDRSTSCGSTSFDCLMTERYLGSPCGEYSRGNCDWGIP